MEDLRDIFKRELDRLTYLYAKANTKSKKKNLAYDLIFFEDMYNSLADDLENVVFPWRYDEVIMEVRDAAVHDFVDNILSDQENLIELVESSFNIFVENEFSVHGDYGKHYHRMGEYLVQKTIVDLYDQIDGNLKYIFSKKFNNSEIFVNNTIKKYAGLFFPLEAVSKNIIFITARNNDMSVEEGRILVHEMGHNFEFENSLTNGYNKVWYSIVRTIYPEVSSSFFEYTYINYLIENNIYKDDALMLKRAYLNQIYYYLCYLLIIFNHRNLRIDPELNIKLDSDEIINYANDLFEAMNVSEEMFEKGEKLSFRVPFIYGIGKLLGIYIYDAYKNNPKDFLANFRVALLEYKNSGMDAFSHLGITYDTMIEGKVLKKELKECK